MLEQDTVGSYNQVTHLYHYPLVHMVSMLLDSYQTAGIHFTWAEILTASLEIGSKCSLEQSGRNRLNPRNASFTATDHLSSV